MPQLTERQARPAMHKNCLNNWKIKRNIRIFAVLFAIGKQATAIGKQVLEININNHFKM